MRGYATVHKEVLTQMLDTYITFRDEAQAAYEEAYEAMRIAGKELDKASEEEYDTKYTEYDRWEEEVSIIGEELDNYEVLCTSLENAIEALENLGE